MQTDRVTECGKTATPYDAVRVVLGAVLLLAAGLKCHQLATEPVLGTGILDSRWFLISVVEFELLFGLWLLANLWPRWARHTALLCFWLFAAVSLYKALSGAPTCGCFGRIEVNPWYTFTLDVAAGLALLRWRPLGMASSTPVASPALLLRATTVTLVWLSVGLPAAVAMATYQPAILAEDGIILGDNDLVVLEPEKWVGQPLPIQAHIDIGGQLAEGKWALLLYHHDCPKCQEVMPLYEQAAQANSTNPVGDTVRLAFVEVPPYGHTPYSSCFSSMGNPIVACRMDDEWDWFVQTPVEITIENGRVTHVSTEMKCWESMHDGGKSVGSLGDSLLRSQGSDRPPGAQPARGA